jgi:hypothetical protein
MIAIIQSRTFCLLICLTKNLKIRIYKTITLPVGLLGSETWTLALKEEHRLRVLENVVLRRISGPKRDEVMERHRKLHNEELHDLSSSPGIMKRYDEQQI